MVFRQRDKEGYVIISHKAKLKNTHKCCVRCVVQRDYDAWDAERFDSGEAEGHDRLSSSVVGWHERTQQMLRTISQTAIAVAVMVSVMEKVRRSVYYL